MSKAEKAVLVIEDELAIMRFLRAALEAEDLQVVEATTGRRGLELAASKKPAIVLLDLGLPDMDGLEVLKGLRQWSSAPVIILSARGQEADKIAALDGGADDYLTKPFGVAELMARVRAALRRAGRAPAEEEPVYEHEGLKVDLSSRRVWVRRKEIRLSPMQYELLAVLVRNAGRVTPQGELMKQVWRDSPDVSPESVRIFVHQLRHKIEPDPVRPRHLKTEPGVGYRLEAPVD